MTKYEKPTITDFKKKGNEALAFEDRGKKFEEAVKPLTEEYGVNYMAIINPTQTAIHATMVVVDLWEKHDDTPKTS